MNRLIILAGAPETTSLDWSETYLTSHEVLSKASMTDCPILVVPSPETPYAQWRQLSKGNDHLRSSITITTASLRPETDADANEAEFFTPDEAVPQMQSGKSSFVNESTISIASTETASEVLSEFYDHSFAAHEDIPSSQLSELEPESAGRSSIDSNSSNPISPSAALRAPWQWPIVPAPQPQHLSDLEDIPNATYLRSIEPQTMTVNLIVGILSIGPPRTVTTGARWGKERETDVVDLLVGDETKTGFSITMWLPPEMRVKWKDGPSVSPDGYRSILRRSLKLLRPRDIILLRNVALNSFRGKVHGQSLKRDVTKVDLLFRKKHNREDLGGSYTVQAVNSAGETDPQVLKVKKVRDWMINFVGDNEEVEAPPRRRKGSRRLPPDTQ